MTTFHPLDLTASYNASRDPTAWPGTPAGQLEQLPAGDRTFWGMPFRLGPPRGLGWIALNADAPVALPIPADAAPRRVSHVLFAHFCGGSHAPTGEILDYGAGDELRPGELLADYALLYTDGGEHHQPIRRRFEISELIIPQWLLLPFAARPHTSKEPRDLQGPHAAWEWGFDQTGMSDEPDEGYGRYWIYALPNPQPERPLAGLRLQACGGDAVAIAGITLYEGARNPLRHSRLETLRVALPQPALPEEVTVSIDLGVVARKYAAPAFDGETWLASKGAYLGEPLPFDPPDSIFLDVTASPDATLTVNGETTPLESLLTAEGPGRVGRVEVVTPRKTWVQGAVVDATTGRPTPVRLRIQSDDGRYFPPYGHRHEVNVEWFQDYGADLKLGATQYAYVDGTFQAELPVGDLYVEVCKGLEYAPTRQRVRIEPGQQELVLVVERPLNWRSRGWITADTHVHFISPQTAALEAQAEGVNLVNLLAAQWGDLFTNVGDLTQRQTDAGRDDTIVWVGTENRQHMLGHISLLGGKGAPVYPLSAAGPDESYFGDPLWTTIAEWADECRSRQGLVVMPHFPVPYCEAAADIVLGKVDAAELRMFNPTLDAVSIREWYRFLNLGYRLASVGGTDKMCAGVPVGASRTYARLGDEEFTFAAWARAVRAGRTFATTGPLVEIQVEGRGPGDELQLPDGGGTVEVEARAESVLPFAELQVVVSGKLVAQAAAERTSSGWQAMLRERIRLTDSCWIAARCASAELIRMTFMPTHVGAHTSPVYARCGNQEQFDRAAATHMLGLIDGGLTWLDTLATPASGERQARARGVFEAARARLTGRMRGH